MRRTIVTAAAVLTLAGLGACRRPNLESTGGGYAKGAAPAAADTGAIAPHEGPAPVDSAPGGG